MKPDVTYPYLIECPFQGPTPSSVSLVEFPCDHAENNLKILDNQPTDGSKKRFGVCSKRARLTDRNFAIRFIEWIHMVQLLGAEKVHFSYEFVHPDLFKIINYFEEQGIIETWQYLNPSGIKDSEPVGRQSRQLQINVQTDCFYRVRNLYDFVAIIDFDEVIMPVIEEDLTWEDILKRSAGDADAYVSKNVYYPDLRLKSKLEVPHFMYMLQHTARSRNFSKPERSVKSIFRTETVLTVHTHMPHQCIGLQAPGYKCRYYDVPTNVSQNSHYRDHLDEEIFNITQEDRTIWKYKEKLVEMVEKTLKDTEFIP